MSETAVTLPFADGEYRFWLPLPQVVELERKTGDTSILDIEQRLSAAIGIERDTQEFVFVGGGSVMVAEVRETIRLALIGGNYGMVDGQEVEVGPLMAKQLIDSYAYPARPLSECALLAWRILHAAIHGVRLKKKHDGEPEVTTGQSLSEKDS